MNKSMAPVKCDIPDYTPSEKSLDIYPEKKGVLFKEILKDGDTTGERPTKGCVVDVLYIGRLVDGTEFDRNTDPNKPFTFDLGEGKVIKGWDAAIQTMYKGEKARVIIHHSLAYGEKGSSGKIPGYATLYFDITLLGWQDEDLSPDKKGGIIRKRIEDGPLKYLTPNKGATVTVALEGSYEAKIFDQRVVEFEIGEGVEKDVCRGIEMCMEKIARGDTCSLTLKPEYAFGETGNEKFGVPPNATVVYKVTLKEFRKLGDVWTLDGKEKLEYAQRFKQKGTNYFKEQKYQLACDQYKFIEDYLKTESTLNGEEEETRKALLCAGYLNQSICWLKLDVPVKAKNAAEDALLLQPNNPKAYYRKGLALLGTNDPELAIKDFQKVLEIEPENKTAQQQLTIAKHKIKEKSEAQKKLFSKMWNYEKNM